MEWIKPIDQVEEDFRRKGIVMLADVRSRKLWFFAYKKDNVVINQAMASMKGRSEEMVKFLIARANYMGETK